MSTLLTGLTSKLGNSHLTSSCHIPLPSTTYIPTHTHTHIYNNYMAKAINPMIHTMETYPPMIGISEISNRNEKPIRE